MTSYYTQDKLREINTNVENLCKATQFTKVETTNVRRDVRFFGVDLFIVNGKPFNQLLYNSDSKKLHYNSDSKKLHLSSKYMAYFIEMFNKGITCNDPNYLLSGNSEFYLAFYRYYFIIILDKINNHSTNKRCFNMDGDLLTEVKDTLSTDGELKREGLEYKAIFKDTVITHLERKIINNNNNNNYLKSTDINDNSLISSSNSSSSKSSYITKGSSISSNIDKVQHQDIQQTAVTSQTEDSKVSISKYQAEDSKVLISKSKSEEPHIKVEGDIPHQKVSKNTPYKILYLV
jgi:hypothetical protein